MWFRIACGLLAAFSTTWVLSRAEAAALLEQVPHMATLGPVAAVFAGCFSLASRQGAGSIGGVANGVWTGVLALALAAVVHIASRLARSIWWGAISDLDGFLNVLGKTAEPLLALLFDVPFLVVLLGASALLGAVTELLSRLPATARRRRRRTG